MTVSPKSRQEHGSRKCLLFQIHNTACYFIPNVFKDQPNEKNNIIPAVAGVTSAAAVVVLAVITLIILYRRKRYEI